MKLNVNLSACCLLTIDNILPLDSSFVLLLAELVLDDETPRLGFIIHSVHRHVSVDTRVHRIYRQEVKVHFKSSFSFILINGN